MTSAYSFLPYLRQGLSNDLKNSSGKVRATFTVNLKVMGDNGNITGPVAPKEVELYGPGDIIGIDSSVVLKTEPLNWITNFEPNYVACIDFYDEDFPWRYTPLTPLGHRLIPWLALVVLKENEFEEGNNPLSRPLPWITVKDSGIINNCFPNPDQLWAWAHVHVNSDIVNETLKDNADKMQGVLDMLQEKISQNPDIAYSRIICPRKLEPGTTYHAFLIPSFESGRLAGIGEPADKINAAGTSIAWNDKTTPKEFPVYYRWQFATGTVGDFEYLVRLLKPMPADLRVGRREMDMTNPGPGLEWKEADDFSLKGILRLGGALQVPEDSLSKDEKKELSGLDGWAKDRFPHPFQVQVAGLLNLSDEYCRKPEERETADPMITPPIYGRWHAMIERVLNDRDGKPVHHKYNWINELNLDPRFRVAAHFGTRVVQENQEDLMSSAWEQIGDVLKANRKIRFAQFAQAASKAWFRKHLANEAATNPERVFMLTAPVHSRVMLDGATVFHTIRGSQLPNAAISASMRRVTRPRGRFIKDLGSKSKEKGFRPEAMLGKLATGKIRVSPVKTIAPDMPSSGKIAEKFNPAGIPGFLLNLLHKWSWLPVALSVILGLALIAFILLKFLTGNNMLTNIGIAASAALGSCCYLLFKWKSAVQAATSINPENQKPGIVDKLPKSADFQLISIEGDSSPKLGGSTDSSDAVAFKEGLRNTFDLVNMTRESVPKQAALRKIDISRVAGHVLEKLDPNMTIPEWTWQHIRIPEGIRGQMDPEVFTEAMAYPAFDLPMYKPLAEISADLFLPNINLIEYNSITLLEPNQKFIEAYMVGLNHEFSRELLWREYPTDQRGSYFRQFWDVSTLLKTDTAEQAGKSEAEIEEMYKDIPNLNTWSQKSKLGSHDYRKKPGRKIMKEVVMVIRGELLKKYPNAVIYAHKATWAPVSDSDKNFDKTKPRMLYMDNEAASDNPSFDVIRTPLYEAKVEPDITFFGFQLDIEEARGESDPNNPKLENAGWFFIIKERPGEPRFGFDTPEKNADLGTNLTWNDISWSEVLKDKNMVIDAEKLPGTLKIPGPDTSVLSGSEELKQQQQEDQMILWNSNNHKVDAADLAYILYQAPVLVAVHASELLTKTK